MVKNKFLVFNSLLLFTCSVVARIADKSKNENQVETISKDISTLNGSSLLIASDVYIESFSQDNEERFPGPSSLAGSSPLCHPDVTSSEVKVTAAGCVMESLIPKDKTYRVSLIFKLITCLRSWQGHTLLTFSGNLRSS